jgi:hypothetical protein
MKLVRAFAVVMVLSGVLVSLTASPALAWGERQTGTGLLSAGPNYSWPWVYVFLDHATTQAVASSLDSGTLPARAAGLAMQKVPGIGGLVGFLTNVYAFSHGGVAYWMRAADRGRGVILYMYTPLFVPIWYHVASQ